MFLYALRSCNGHTVERDVQNAHLSFISHAARIRTTHLTLQNQRALLMLLLFSQSGAENATHIKLSRKKTLCGIHRYTPGRLISRSALT